jgi:hypothetical protein
MKTYEKLPDVSLSISICSYKTASFMFSNSLHYNLFSSLSILIRSRDNICSTKLVKTWRKHRRLSRLKSIKVFVALKYLLCEQKNFLILRIIFSSDLISILKGERLEFETPEPYGVCLFNECLIQFKSRNFFRHTIDFTSTFWFLGFLRFRFAISIMKASHIHAK